MPALFISHSSRDKAWAEALDRRLGHEGEGYDTFLDSHPDHGIHAGAEWERLLWLRVRQCQAVVVLCSPHWLASPWCVAEAMIARERGKPVVLLATEGVVDGRQVKGAEGYPPTVAIPDFLKGRQFLNVAGLSEDQIVEQLVNGLAREGVTDIFPLPNKPYPGLRPFDAADAAVFCGRGDDIERVSNVLNRRLGGNARGFIVVLGASGCGKSSLVRAGILPRLDGARQTSKDLAERGVWITVGPLLAGGGLDALNRALKRAAPAGLSGEEQRELLQEIRAATDDRTDPDSAQRALRNLANTLLTGHGSIDGRVLVVVDQLEEVFGTPEGSRPRLMLGRLLAATADSDSSFVVLSTMRSDFLNALQLFPGAAEAYGEVTLDPMPTSRFAELIEGPAQRCGVDIQPGLTEQLVEDTRYDDALPLLAYTLEQLYTACERDGQITLDAYQHLFPKVVVREDGGDTEYRGVSAAIKHTADDILRQAGYLDLDEDDPRMRELRRAFYSLAQIGADEQFTRRTARWSQMPASESCRRLLARFEDNRLLASGTARIVEDGAEQDVATLSVTHEALFRVWDTLRGWLQQDRKALALRAQIRDAAQQWDEAGRTESRRWPEERILDAVFEVERSGVRLDDVANWTTVRKFLGPTDPEELKCLPALTDIENARSGIAAYGVHWKLPLSHEARASVGVRLALLGDPRPGVGLATNGLPSIEWCPVDSAEVSLDIRADRTDPRSEIVDTASRRVRAFSISRYLVTVAQYQAFLRECYRQGRWHLPPEFPLDLAPDYRPPRHSGRYPNCPADSINWFDAAMFCHWLSDRLGVEVWLPDEFEWQLAATGGDPARIYPWGSERWEPEAEPWRTNVSQGGTRGMVAVGLCPAGAAPCGALDMVGTIWQWCRNTYVDPQVDDWDAKSEDGRVIRGGYWPTSLAAAKSVDRARNHVNSRLNVIGFRVCSSCTSNHK